MRRQTLKIHFRGPKCCVLLDMVLKMCAPFVWQGRLPLDDILKSLHFRSSVSAKLKWMPTSVPTSEGLSAVFWDECPRLFSKSYHRQSN